MSTLALLARQDPAVRVIPRGIITSLCVGLFFRIQPDLALDLAALDIEDLPGGFGPMYLVTMLLVLTFVLSANTWTRASRISVGLPLSTRTTWLVRTASLIAVAATAIFAMACTLGVTVTIEGFALNPVVALAALRATATAVLLILLYQLPIGDRDRIPISATYVIYVIFISLVIVPFSAAGITSLAGSAFFLAASIGLGAWIYVRTPETWSVGPSVEESNQPVWPHEEVGESGAVWSWETSAAHSRPGRFVHWTLFRSFNSFLPKWLILIGIAGAMAVATLEFFDGTNAFLPLVLVTVWHLPVLQMSLERMTPYDPLPIPRRTLWIHAIGPAVLAIFIGVFAAHLVYRVDPSKWSPIHVTTCCLEVPWEYLEIAPDGMPPTITAPWGERITPKAEPLWRGTQPAFYDPYEINAESTPRFAEYQIRRAAAAVFAVRPDHDRTASQEATVRAGSDAVDHESLIKELTRGKPARGRSRSAAVTLFLCTVIMLCLMVPALLQYGSSVHRKLFKWASWGALIFLGMLAVAVAVARLAGYTEPWYVGAVVSIGIRQLAEWLPLPTGLLWGLGVTCWLGAYLGLGRIFKRIELPGRNTVNRFAEEY